MAKSKKPKGEAFLIVGAIRRETKSLREVGRGYLTDRAWKALAASEASVAAGEGSACVLDVPADRQAYVVRTPVILVEAERVD
jgi:hypothetical protein